MSGTGLRLRFGGTHRVARFRRECGRQSMLFDGSIKVLYITCAMTPSRKKQTAFRIDPEILEGLQDLKARDGIPLSEQMRRALRRWLESKGIGKAERKRVTARKRP